MHVPTIMGTNQNEGSILVPAVVLAIHGPWVLEIVEQSPEILPICWLENKRELCLVAPTCVFLGGGT